MLVQLTCALLMTGLIWLVQVVHYPLFARVGAEQFQGYEAAHTAQIGRIVIPLMLVELVASLGCVLWPPAQASRAVLWAALGLVAVIWLVTAACSVPAHTTLGRGFDPAAHRRLVSTNWLRTLAWTARSALLLWLVAPMVLS